jgi:homoserine kinase
MVLRRSTGDHIVITHTDDFGLPTDPEHNVAGVALRAIADAAGCRDGFELRITKNIKPGSGIGSSAASACGAVVAANELLGRPFPRAELVEFAMAGEVVASGSWHADNLAPCIYGGFTLVRSTEPLDVVTLEHPRLYAAVIHPQIVIKTSEARSVLPREVPLKDAISNWSNLGAFVSALSSGDENLLSRSMVDTIIEPARQHLLPYYNDVRSAGLAAGAIGGGISGSGPSMFMLCRDLACAHDAAAAMAHALTPFDIEFLTYVSPVSRTGTAVM